MNGLNATIAAQVPHVRNYLVQTNTVSGRRHLQTVIKCGLLVSQPMTLAECTQRNVTQVSTFAVSDLSSN